MLARFSRLAAVRSASAMASASAPSAVPRFSCVQGPATRRFLTASSRCFTDKKTGAHSEKGESSSEKSTGESAENSAKESTNPTDAAPKDQPDFSQLPDLTQGIPSTFAFEQAAREKAAREGAAAAANPNLDLGADLNTALSRAVAEAKDRHGSDNDSDGSSDKKRRDSAYKSSAERKQEAVAKYSLVLILLGMVGGVAYLGRDWDSAEEAAQHANVPNGWGLGLWWARVRARMTETVSYYQEPAFEKLLPELDASLQKPYTLCISLEDMLVHSSWDRQRGWALAKRPGVDYFLRYLSQYYELVLFTSVPSMNALPTIQKLDPFQFIMFPLFREATKYEDGEIVKDLSYLNRDLSKVIMIDTNARHVRKQPENAIILPKWKGNPRDTDLVDLVPFLEYLATMQTSDVRKVIKSFEGKKIPEEFSRREAIARAEFQKQLAARKPKSSASSFVGNLLGLKAGPVPGSVDEINPAEAFAQGKMLHDIARERGQRYYQMLEADLKANGERYLKEQKEAMEKQQQEAMNNMMGSFSGMFVPETK
ncbi:hypothetical protein TD95_002911 [Thielaviopsis punctulata]|uniref:Mitochondrial import inner membrane translocase subunit TIM50 n=1 Tax=Thielaviopsis punctulata TaxID=72032 RepID=A0A0F4ZDH2_9PEZI|nr:hypothetical protein TD95_002911 [Thielaviopsis punctulata]